MKYSEVLNRYVNTGSLIPENQYDRLSPSLKKSYMRMRGISGYKKWEFKLLSEDEKLKFIEIKNWELTNNQIIDIFDYSPNKVIIAIKIIETFGINLDDYIILEIILPQFKDSKNKDNVIIKIIETLGENLRNSEIKYLLKNSDNKDEIAIKIIKSKGEKLDNNSIENLLKYSENSDIIATKIIDTKGEKLNEYEIENLFKYSKDKDLIATKIIDTKGKKLDKFDILNLLKYSDNKELIKKTLLQQGIDYELINSVIRFNDLDISLIPDNYQEMLNEIRRIKEIMK
jgi:hypothetical protein